MSIRKCSQSLISDAVTVVNSVYQTQSNIPVQTEVIGSFTKGYQLYRIKAVKVLAFLDSPMLTAYSDPIIIQGRFAFKDQIEGTNVIYFAFKFGEAYDIELDALISVDGLANIYGNIETLAIAKSNAVTLDGIDIVLRFQLVGQYELIN